MMNNESTVVFEALNCSANHGLWFTATGLTHMTGLSFDEVKEGLAWLATAGLIKNRPSTADALALEFAVV